MVLQSSSNQQKQQQKRLTSFFGIEESNNNNNAGSDASNSNDKRPRRQSSFSGNKRSNVCRRPLSGSAFSTCPICQSSFPWHVIERHAANCDGGSSSSSIKKPPTKTQKNDAKLIPMIPSTRHNRDSSASPRTSTVTAIPSYSEQPIPGLFLYPNFITEEEEAQIIKELDRTDVVPAWKSSYFNGKSYGKRWGVHCNLRDRRVDAEQHEMPSVLMEVVISKLAMLPSHITKGCCKPNEANAIDYRRKHGHWLKSHVDDRYLSKEAIFNLSLAGDCYMTFQNVATRRNLEVTTKKVFLKRRCLQILTGKARYEFSHGIDNIDLLSDRRASITMRESPLTTTTSTTTGTLRRQQQAVINAKYIFVNKPS